MDRTPGAGSAGEGAAVGCGYFTSTAEAFKGLNLRECIEPQTKLMDLYQSAYQKWCRNVSGFA